MVASMLALTYCPAGNSVHLFIVKTPECFYSFQRLKHFQWTEMAFGYIVCVGGLKAADGLLLGFLILRLRRRQHEEGKLEDWLSRMWGKTGWLQNCKKGRRIATSKTTTKDIKHTPSDVCVGLRLQQPVWKKEKVAQIFTKVAQKVAVVAFTLEWCFSLKPNKSPQN